jgi:Fic family protein
MVIEHGVTIGGKPLKDHLEAVDHFEALRYVRDLARHSAPSREADIRNLHRLVVRRSDPDTAGRYVDQGRYVETDSTQHHFHAPEEVPALMGEFAPWLVGSAAGPLETAFAAHRRGASIEAHALCSLWMRPPRRRQQ